MYKFILAAAIVILAALPTQTDAITIKLIAESEAEEGLHIPDDAASCDIPQHAPWIGYPMGKDWYSKIHLVNFFTDTL